LEVVQLCPTTDWGFSHRGARSQEDEDNTENGLGYTIMKKLHEIGRYLNTGYHVFVDNCFMSVPLVCHLPSAKHPQHWKCYEK
jgi:hypothetical protein